MAAIAPDWLAGVVAIDGYIPMIEGWSLPAGDTGELPMLFVYDSNPCETDRGLAEISVQEFRRRNAAIECARVDGLLGNPLASAPVVSAWLEKTLWNRTMPPAPTSSS
jgi:hypothetical protein